MTTTIISDSTITSPVVATLWAATAFDCGLYGCRVDQLEDHSGKLSVTLLGFTHNHVLHEQAVRLSIGSDGKPDLADVDGWKRICDGVIENPDLRSCRIRG